MQPLLSSLPSSRRQASVSSASRAVALLRSAAWIAAAFALVMAVPMARADNPDGDWGWAFMTGQDGYTNFSIPVTGSANIHTYIDQKYTASKITRAIVQIHGHGRDCWNYAKHTSTARDEAVETMGLDASTILSIAPEFFGIGDMKAGAFKPSDNHLCWLGDDWSGGVANIPDCTPGIGNISSFEAMDAIVTWLSDNTKFPKLDTIVISGHSLGGQYVHRYTSLGRPQPRSGIDIIYWVGNPASWLYLSDARPSTPKALKNCSDYDQYKYGVQGIDIMEGYDGITPKPADIWTTYSSKSVHLALGLADDGSGDLGCEGLVQGKSHLDRGIGYLNYQQMFLGGMPAAHTVDFMPGVTHNAGKMLTQPVSLKRLFYDRGNNQQPSQAPNGVANGVNVTFADTEGHIAMKDMHVDLSGGKNLNTGAPASSSGTTNNAKSSSSSSSSSGSGASGNQSAAVSASARSAEAITMPAVMVSLALASLALTLA